MALELVRVACLSMCRASWLIGARLVMDELGVFADLQVQLLVSFHGTWWILLVGLCLGLSSVEVVAEMLTMLRWKVFKSSWAVFGTCLFRETVKQRPRALAKTKASAARAKVANLLSPLRLLPLRRPMLAIRAKGKVVPSEMRVNSWPSWSKQNPSTLLEDLHQAKRRAQDNEQLPVQNWIVDPLAGGVVSSALAVKRISEGLPLQATLVSPRWTS